MLGVGLGACTEDLLPGESVLGGERAATFRYGEPDDRLGDGLAWNGVSLVAAAPGRPAVLADGAWSDGPAAWVGWWGEALVRVGPGTATVDGVALAAPEAGWLIEATARAASPAGLYVAHAGALRRVDTGASVALADIDALAADAERVVASVCPPGEPCTVQAFDAGLTPLGAVADAEGQPLLGGSGGALAIDAGAVCVGDPRLDLDDGAGQVRCEDGRGALGEPGDHLGAAVGGGHAAGRFNRLVLPPRARVVPLDGGEVLALDVGAENQPLRLAGDDTVLWIGAPFHPHGGAPSGALVQVAR